MVSLKTLKPHLFHTLFRHHKPSLLTSTRTPFSTSTQLVSSVSQSETEFKKKKPLDILFKEIVGLSKPLEQESEVSVLEESEVAKTLMKIEREVRAMKGVLKDRETKKVVKVVEPKSLHSIFTKNGEKEKEDSVSCGELKPMMELSREMILFVECLHEKGYLKDANFLPKGKLDFGCFTTVYSRGYLRSAAERFGKDRPDIVKCLSESDMKRLALFGCPSVEYKTAFAAKKMRSYFNIQEDIVCRSCQLNRICKVKYSTVGKKAEDLNIVDVMRTLTLYALELGPPELTVPDAIKESISTLLKQVLEHNQ